MAEESGQVGVRAGRADAAAQGFAAAYRDLFLAAMRLAYRMTGDRALAEDLAAEALARAYSRWSSVSALESPLAWVLRVTTNLTVDAVRRQRLTTRLLPVLVVRDPTARFDEHVTQRLALVSALASLPRRQREAIALHYLSGLDEQEVAAALDISASSVRTHVQRGLAGLRKKLGPATTREVTGAAV